MNTKRTGKIARLPKDAREIVNEMLEDGATYDAILQKLQGLGYSDFNAMNLHRWKNGGYRDWQLDQVNPIREQNLAFLEDPHPDGSGLGSLRLASEHFYRVLMDFDHNLLRQQLNQHPENYFRILRSFNHLIQNRFTLERRIQDKAFQKAWNKHQEDLEKKKSKPCPRQKKALPEPKELDAEAEDQAAA